VTSLISVEEINRESLIERGEYNNLHGQGEPIDLRDYFNTPLVNKYQ